MFVCVSPYLCSTAFLSHLSLCMGAFLGDDAFWLLCNFVRNRCIDCPLIKGSVISKYFSNLLIVLVIFKQRFQTFAVFAEASSGVRFFSVQIIICVRIYNANIQGFRFWVQEKRKTNETLLWAVMRLFYNFGLGKLLSLFAVAVRMCVIIHTSNVVVRLDTYYLLHAAHLL